MAVDHCFGGVVYEILKSNLNQNTDLKPGFGETVDRHTQTLEHRLIMSLGQRKPPDNVAADRGVKKLGIIFGMNRAVREKEKCAALRVANYSHLLE